MPELGESSTRLGIRDRDIPVVQNGLVMPVDQGLSIVPNNPTLLLESHLSEDIRKEKVKVWGIYEQLLDSRLAYRPDPAKPLRHGFIAPAIPMPVALYRQLIDETQRQWSPLTQ